MCLSGGVKSHRAKVSENDQELTEGHLRTMAHNLALGDSRMCHIFCCPGGLFPHHAPCRTAEIRLPLTFMASASTTCFYSGEAAGPPSSVWALRARRDCLTSGGRVIPASSFTCGEISRPSFLSSVTLSREPATVSTLREVLPSVLSAFPLLRRDEYVQLGPRS